MPDIKTALAEALKKTATAWAADDEAHKQIEPQQEKPVTINISATDPTTPIITEAVTENRVNLSRTTFEYVRDNPGLTTAQVTAALVAQGHNANSVSSLCYQMLRVRLIVADGNGKLSAVVQEYAPIQTSLLRKKKAKPKAKPVQYVAPAPAPALRKHVEIVNTRTGEVLNPRKEEWTVESVIGGLNVRQAMAVYDELRKIFGA